MQGNWELREAGNSVLMSDDKKFWISFQPDTGQINEMFMPLVAIAGGDVEAHTASNIETALVRRGDLKNEYYILMGDWREDYDSLVREGWDACYAFYLFHSEVKSAWSSDT